VDRFRGLGQLVGTRHDSVIEIERSGGIGDVLASVEQALLPADIHDCTLGELEERFARDRWVENKLHPCRNRLFGRLRDYLTELRRVGLPAALLVNGSFVTDKPEPGDIDLAFVLPSDHNFVRDLSPREYSMLSKRRVRQEGYPFDLFVVAEGSTQHAEVVQFFHKVKDRPGLTKGFLRVWP
jgi:hypothetical protein